MHTMPENLKSLNICCKEITKLYIFVYSNPKVKNIPSPLRIFFNLSFSTNYKFEIQLNFFLFN